MHPAPDPQCPRTRWPSCRWLCDSLESREIEATMRPLEYPDHWDQTAGQTLPGPAIDGSSPKTCLAGLRGELSRRTPARHCGLAPTACDPCAEMGRRPPDRIPGGLADEHCRGDGPALLHPVLR